MKKKTSQKSVPHAAGVVLQELTGPFRAIAESTPDAVVITDNDLKIIFWNNGARKIFGYSKEEVLGKSSIMLVSERYRERIKLATEKSSINNISSYPGRTNEMYGIKKDGREFSMEVSNFFWKTEGKFCFGAIIRDITMRKKAEKVLKDSHNALELRVQERTSTLTKTNEELSQVIGNLKKAEQEVQKREKELKQKTNNLQEANIALKVLLRKREEDKQELEEKILSNVRMLIDPYFEMIKQ